MKLLIISLLALTSCGITNNTVNPIQVRRSTLTIDRIETHNRQFGSVYYIIWTDHKGIEYQEEIKRAADTSWVRVGTSSTQLLKR